MQQVADRLNVKSTDTAVRWCYKNKLAIFNIAGKNQVAEYDFKLAYEKPLVDSLKNRYKDKWQEVYAAYASEDIREFEKATSTKIAPSQAFDFEQFRNRIGYAQDVSECG